MTRKHSFPWMMQTVCERCSVNESFECALSLCTVTCRHTQRATFPTRTTTNALDVSSSTSNVSNNTSKSYSVTTCSLWTDIRFRSWPLLRTRYTTPVAINIERVIPALPEFFRPSKQTGLFPRRPRNQSSKQHHSKGLPSQMSKTTPCPKNLSSGTHDTNNRRKNTPRINDTRSSGFGLPNVLDLQWSVTKTNQRPTHETPPKRRGRNTTKEEDGKPHLSKGRRNPATPPKRDEKTTPLQRKKRRRTTPPPPTKKKENATPPRGRERKQHHQKEDWTTTPPIRTTVNSTEDGKPHLPKGKEAPQPTEKERGEWNHHHSRGRRREEQQRQRGMRKQHHRRGETPYQKRNVT